MKITPTGTVPPLIADTGAMSPSQQAARERAVSMLSSQPNQDSPVDQNRLAPEDFSAIVAQSKASETQNNPEVEQVEEVPEQKPEVKEDSYSAKLAQLAKRERALRARVQQQEQTLKSRESELAKREQELTGRSSQYEQDYIPKSRLKSATFESLIDAGVDVGDILTKAEQYRETPVDPRIQNEMRLLRDTIAKLEKANEDNQKNAQQASTDQYQAAVRQIASDVNSLVKSDPSFEAIRHTKSQKDVVELIEATWKEEQRVMSVEEAAQEVEDYLTEQLTNYSTQIKKIRARIESNATATQRPQAGQKPQPNKQPQMKTLTNANSTGRRLNARERAIAAFRGDKIG
jgi:hypothetical protein